jgi:hypothetical protein
VAGLIVVLGVAGIVLAAVGVWGGFVAASLLAIAIAAWARKGARLRFVPSETGDYVLVPRSASAEAPGSPAVPPAMSTRGRVVCGALGVVFLAIVVLATMEGVLPSAAAHAGFLLGAGLGMGLIYTAVKGELPFSPAPELPPASPRFRALADPTRPLPEDAPISGPREREAGGADRTTLP